MNFRNTKSNKASQTLKQTTIRIGKKKAFQQYRLKGLSDLVAREGVEPSTSGL